MSGVSSSVSEYIGFASGPVHTLHDHGPGHHSAADRRTQNPSPTHICEPLRTLLILSISKEATFVSFLPTRCPHLDSGPLMDHGALAWKMGKGWTLLLDILWGPPGTKQEDLAFPVKLFSAVTVSLSCDHHAVTEP